MKNVLVTGASGHLGYSLVKLLKERGYNVRATVRNVNDEVKTRLLKKLKVETVQADLMDKPSLLGALQGMDGLFQVAAVFDLNAQDPERDLIRPNVDGTRNILEAAAEAGIKKIVYTSSIAAIGAYKMGDTPRDESNWNDQAPEPYARSKALSEQVAWELAESLNLNLVTVLPGTITGPQFQQLTSSLGLIRDIITNKVPMALPMSNSYVDVRDVAEAHLKVYENDSASGRYIATHESLTVSEVGMMLKELRPTVKMSDKVMPATLAWALPAFDYLQHKLTGSPRSLNLNLLREYLGKTQDLSAKRLREEMGWKPRSMKESFRETVDLIESTQLQFS